MDGPEGPPEIFTEGWRVVVGARVRELLQLFVLEGSREGVEDLMGLHITVGVNVLPGDDIGMSRADHGVGLSEGK